jgi:hypothetical protein
MVIIGPAKRSAAQSEKQCAGAVLQPPLVASHEAPHTLRHVLGRRSGESPNHGAPPTRDHTARVFRGKTAQKASKKKQHARAKKARFRLETGFFSSSIRTASEKADSLVMSQLPQ